MAKTTTQFLDAVKTRITMAANQVLLDDAKLLELGSEILRSDLVALLRGSKQNYMVKVTDIPLVGGKDGYDLPERSVAGGLRELKLIVGDTLRKLPLVNIEDLDLVARSGTPSGFYFRDEQLMVTPTPPDDAYSLRAWYYQYLSSLCPVGDAGRVIGISGTTVTLSALPQGWVPGTLVDFVRGKSICTTLGIDAPITNISGTQVSFTEIPARLDPGDWVAPAGFTPVLPIPDSCYRYFEGLTGVSALNTIGDYEGAERLNEKEVKVDERDLKEVLEPRIDGEIEKVVNFRGLLRQKTWRRRGW